MTLAILNGWGSLAASGSQACRLNRTVLKQRFCCKLEVSFAGASWSRSQFLLAIKTWCKRPALCSHSLAGWNDYLEHARNGRCLQASRRLICLAGGLDHRLHLKCRARDQLPRRRQRPIRGHSPVPLTHRNLHEIFRHHPLSSQKRFS